MTTHWIDTHIWLIPAMPLLGALINIFFGRKLSKSTVGAMSSGLVFASFVLSVIAVVRLAGIEGERPQILNYLAPWIKVGVMQADWAFRVDRLSSIMILVVSGVGFLIHVYSTGYMSHDPRFSRFFAYLNLFTFAMLVLVLASNVFLMFIGWEGVGLCSYLLIGFWFEELKNARAGMKAFVVNRVGDFSFLAGALLLFWTLGDLPGGGFSLDFYKINELAHLLPAGTAMIIGILLFGGATGKSAQLPLYIWLPDAMAGPTPVSALIHAATMVTAGVYMIARMSGLFIHSPEAMNVIATVGALTAIFSATIAFAQNDIKKVLAYSTVSQLGYMFLGVGVGAFSAGVFHLMTHAFFKGLLFLGAGSVIHGMHHEQDMRKMGGLRKYMPWTWITFMAGWVAIAGIPPFAGFFSKDEILWKTFESGHKGLWVIAAIAAAMTAFYMTRLVVMTFYGEKRWDKGVHAHESPRAMTVPLAVLAVLSVLGGFIGVPAVLGGSNHIEHWMAPAVEWEAEAVGHEASATSHETAPAEHNAEGMTAEHGEGMVEHGEATAEHAIAAPVAEPPKASHETPAGHGGSGANHAAELGLMGLSVAIALMGVLIGWWMYTRRTDIPKSFVEKFPNLHRWVLNKYYVDEIYDVVVVQNLLRITRVSARFDSVVVDGAVNGTALLTIFVTRISGWIDATFVDGAVNLVAGVVREIGYRIKAIQTGKVQEYLTFAAGAVLLIAAVWIMRGALL